MISLGASQLGTDDCATHENGERTTTGVGLGTWSFFMGIPLLILPVLSLFQAPWLRQTHLQDKSMSDDDLQLC